MLDFVHTLFSWKLDTAHSGIRRRSTAACKPDSGSQWTIWMIKGCPQEGFLSPFLCNLVVDSLLSNTKEKIPCHLQGRPCAISHHWSTKSLGNSGLWREHSSRDDAEKSRAHQPRVQRKRSLTKCGSALKHTQWRSPELVRSTRQTTQGTDIEIRNTTKLLGVTHDSKLSLDEHIERNARRQRHPDSVQESHWITLGLHAHDHDMDLNCSGETDPYQCSNDLDQWSK